MELVIDPDVTESLAEIAACCLCHTSFYGFTEEQTKAKFESWGREITDEEHKYQQVQEWVKMIKEAGGTVPNETELMAIPSFRDKVKVSKVPMMQEYLNRIGMIAEFVVNNLPNQTDITNLPVEDLCKLFYANHFIEYNYKSYCNDENIRAEYLKELIDKYEAFNCGILDNGIIVFSSSKDYPLMMEETSLAAYIAGMTLGNNAFIYKIDDSLKKELRINVAFYEYEETETKQI